MKPDVSDVLAILKMKDEATRLYEEIDRRIATMKATFGAGRFDYELPADLHADGSQVEFIARLREDGEFIKFEIEDNLAMLQAGESIYKSVSMKPVTFSARSLKRRPESLK